MKQLVLTNTLMAQEQNERIQATVKQERKRLLHFIRQRVSNSSDAEDILQDVLYQFTEYLRLGTQIDSITGWLFAVTRNRITDWFRKKKETPFTEFVREVEGEEVLFLPELLADTTMEADTPMMRKFASDAIMEAIDELPQEQKQVFLQHELEGKSFKQMSEETGVSVNTLLSRKRYAVLYLRERLADLYEEFLDNGSNH
ncbi:RNA polymerase sigma factor [Chitinophaga vietnamensis]|uniref:RNA polymerase sigma factor n=1 Tax=Chitinophaga vietnamensis TaxID=2593957 RepID=UPI001F3AC879|nr:RNA polymerase sigma factor [Chitinophaga vietnamensis]